ncbi:hypothetical protein GGX14DRAFT_571124 [Mycena pura]|uniref:DUF6589 domain-containing protein n=1 Tax=Mycena pura TaxID=153505 RepID=A0AAD6V660_9AGAR|nr:hypothetical protein GGX14DRAFT_571124 [Mycena pura]
MDFRDQLNPQNFYGQPSPRPSGSRLPPRTPATPAVTAPLSSMSRMRAPRRSQWEKMHDILGHISHDLDGLGNFLELLFYIRPHGTKDVRTPRHKAMVTAFLGGQTKVKMGHIIDLIYHHRQSQPPPGSEERDLAFSHNVPHTTISFARPSISSWALVLVGKEARKQIGALTKNDPTDPTDTTQLRASTNGRIKDAVVADWDKLTEGLNIPKMAAKYARRGRVPWYLTEIMAAPTKGGAVVIRQRRPHTTIQVGAISSFVLSRNRYASGYLALPLAVWQFACKSHIDEKRVFSRFGFTVHDSTARACLDSLTDTGLAKLRESVAEGVAVGEMRWQYVLDNVQKFCRQRDLRLGRQDVLKVGCAATAILLEDCAPGAFNLQDHLDRVMKQERKEMTTDSLYADIDWDYIHDLTALHWVRIFVNFAPQLAHLRKVVEAAFDSERMTKLRLRRGRKATVQPLGTNAERETETPGMLRAMLDFEGQMGLDEKAMEGLIITPRGDGASIAAMWRIKKYLSAHPSHYKAFRNRVPPGPEIWHTRWTQLNAISSNCFGPATATDPAALSKSATAAGAKRPSDLKKVDFWPTSRSMILFFEARVLDCWRVFFEANDIFTYLETAADVTTFDLDTLWANARTLVRRYASQEAYHQALSRDFADSASEEMKVARGTEWTAPIHSNAQLDQVDENQADLEEQVDGAAQPETFVEPGEEAPEEILSDTEETGKKKKKKQKKKTAHTEASDFSGDRTLANDDCMGWWVIAAHAVPDGEIGRLWEIMKIWIFCFSGSANRNYASYLLETYCLHRYESSKDFSNAMLNNWLINLSGKKWTECDFTQEGFNKWLEELVDHKGGDFDDHFYRHTLAPNVFHFLRFKEHIEEAFELKHRSKTHGAPHLRNEFQQLLRMHKEDELHLFRPGRTMGHAAINYFGRGYERLDDGRMDHFIEQSTAYSDIMIDVLQQSANDPPLTSTDEQELDRMIQYAIDNPDLFPDPFPNDSEDESDGDEQHHTADDEGDIGIHGLEYSDEEELDDGPEGKNGRATEEPESEWTDEEDEYFLEHEEEELDHDLPIMGEDYSTAEE